jgi:hypothetical protein
VLESPEAIKSNLYVVCLNIFPKAANKSSNNGEALHFLGFKKVLVRAEFSQYRTQDNVACNTDKMDSNFASRQIKSFRVS